ncbi:hypothetical protein BKP35_05170 [Anaerobacillus arseniciselenatis]|uniref:Cytochrome c-552/4 domain-containing protein n=1 Tax=Anaerobacillus arseniciselenatis TaxID=85682 RepID=A0A1S2LRV0_9BACI|nr:multiheme c-type cytochrome [Anaerobacillus arseniciselenatis]OIJ15241.1 hypothetical protein BKP35_05170 [Anaerobacillus arseniciselenatis]
MNMKKLFILLIFALTTILVVSGCSNEQTKPDEEQGAADEKANDVAEQEELEVIAEEGNRFEAGAFQNPETCGGCHTDIHSAWSGSMHRYAWENDLYQADYLKASAETDGFTDVFCAECHTPVSVRTGQLPPADGSLIDDTSKMGVSCDYCHTVSEVVEPVNVQTISEPGDAKQGPRGDGDSPVHEVEFSEVVTDASFCGSCHNVDHPTSGVAVIDTYTDWKEGPYAAEGIRCQDCHMSPTPGVAKNPGKSAVMGEERDHIATHYFPGGSAFFHERQGDDTHAEMSRQMLEAAATLEAEASKTGDGLELITRVTNVGAGHKIPTGVTYIRKMWLEVTVTDESGQELFTSGHIIDGNHVDEDAVFYRVLFKDGDGNLTNKSWRAEGIGYDRRIAPNETDEETYVIPVQEDNINITVRLMYRSYSQESINESGLDNLQVPSIEMARTEFQVK